MRHRGSCYSPRQRQVTERKPISGAPGVPAAHACAVEWRAPAAAPRYAGRRLTHTLSGRPASAEPALRTPGLMCWTKIEDHAGARGGEHESRIQKRVDRLFG